MQKIIVDGNTRKGKSYPIQPEHIDASKRFVDAFGNGRREEAAQLIVSLCQSKRCWAPFTLKEINNFTLLTFSFNGLNGFGNPKDKSNYIIKGADGKYRVTHEFITRCFLSSPTYKITT